MTDPRLRWVLPGLALPTAVLAAVLMRAPHQWPGRQLYLDHCATCHGVNLEGEPNWQTPLPSGLLPAPPHDATGHTWHHSDAILTAIVRDGMQGLDPDAISGMPAFGDVLTDGQIEAVLDYIKSAWPTRERQWQQRQTQADAD